MTGQLEYLRAAMEPRAEHARILSDEVRRLLVRRIELESEQLEIERALLARLPGLERHVRALDNAIASVRHLIEMEREAPRG